MGLRDVIADLISEHPDLVKAMGFPLRKPSLN